MIQALVLLRGGKLRNETAPWFGRFSNRQMFAKLGYTSPLSELTDEEAEWFKAISIGISQAEDKLEEERKRKGNRK